MDNGNMPAMPQSATSEGYSCNYYDYGGPGIPTGLTKREMMAAMLPDVGMEIDSRAVPGFIGRDVNWGDILDGLKASAEVEAIHRVIRADALLAELDRKCQKS